mmetsp:Transcript_13432/g.25547  ORF Transcript_13432/g.25547 Transcript_13432/m.25547 type:complete len:130 (+) Transcript_13432:1503-1892(+)
MCRWRVVPSSTRITTPDRIIPDHVKGRLPPPPPPPVFLRRPGTVVHKDRIPKKLSHTHHSIVSSGRKEKKKKQASKSATDTTQVTVATSRPHGTTQRTNKQVSAKSYYAQTLPHTTSLFAVPYILLLLY